VLLVVLVLLVLLALPFAVPRVDPDAAAAAFFARKAASLSFRDFDAASIILSGG
jgi:hypothetical protein